MLKGMEAYAKELGYSQAQLALAWAVANKQVSTCLLGFSRLEQIDENMKSLELLKKWSPEIEKKTREIFDNEPDMGMMFGQMVPTPNPRDNLL